MQTDSIGALSFRTGRGVVMVMEDLVAPLMGRAFF